MGGKDARLACGSLLEAPLRRGLRELSQHAIRSDAPSLCDRQRRRLIFQANLLIFSRQPERGGQAGRRLAGKRGAAPFADTQKKRAAQPHAPPNCAPTLTPA